jgi:ferredoxin
MATAIVVRFEQTGLQLDVAAGERVLDALDEHPALGLPTACRAGNCGACLVEVTAGMAALAEPAALERRTLAEIGASADQRLGCQLRARAELESGSGPVVLRVVRR